MIVEDVCESPIFVGTEALDVQLRAGIQAVQSTPLIGRSGTPLGMISTHWRTRHRPGEAVLRLLDVLAREVSDVIEHVQAEADQRRTETEQRFLAEAGAALASLEYEETLRNVARVAVRMIADFAVLFVVEEGRSLRRAACASRDPAMGWCADLMLQLPPQPTAEHPAWRIINTRSPTIVELRPELYEALAQSPEHLNALRTAKPRCDLGVPLLLGDKCTGALLIRSVSRVFEPRDVRLMEELARRCALFIENARLHAARVRAIQSRDEVLGIVAHDLRNPLNTLTLQLELLRLGVRRGDGQHPDPVAAIKKASTRMNRIIADLLTMTRLEAGQLAVDRIPLATHKLMTEIAETQRALVESHGLELRLELTDGLPEVLADRDRISQVLENLIGQTTCSARRSRPRPRARSGARRGGGNGIANINVSARGKR